MSRTIVGVLACVLIVAFDAVAGVLGIEAEIAQNKGKRLKVFFLECKEPVHQAYQLGLAAAILVGITQVITTLIGGCICTFSKEEFTTSSKNKQLASVTLVLSWIILAVGFSLLIIGALSNSKSKVSCGFAHRKFLSNGGILCFVHGALCVAYYVSATAFWKEGRGRVTRELPKV